jgi:hypothetical protein
MLQARGLYKKLRKAASAPGAAPADSSPASSDLSVLGQKKEAIIELVEQTSAITAIEGAADTVLFFFGAISNDIAIFLAEVGLSVPILRTLKSVTMIVTHGALTIRTIGKQKAVYHALADVPPLAQWAGQGVYDVFQQKIYSHYVNLGSNIVDGVASLFDHTGASGIATAGMRLGYKVTITYRAWKMTKKVNINLADRSQFSLELLKECPLLGCYILAGDVGADLLNDLDNRINDTTGRFRNKVELEKQHKSTQTLVDAARGRIFAAPYVLLTKNNQVPDYITNKKLIMGNVF